MTMMVPMIRNHHDGDDVGGAGDENYLLKLIKGKIFDGGKCISVAMTMMDDACSKETAAQ